MRFEREGILGWGELFGEVEGGNTEQVGAPNPLPAMSRS